MAFAVTPTSGDAPYILTADFANSHNIDGVNYAIEVRTSMREGSCPFDSAGSLLSASIVDSLLADGTVNSGFDTVDSGSCRVFTLRLRRLSDNMVLSRESVSVDNI